MRLGLFCVFNLWTSRNNRSELPVLVEDSDVDWVFSQPFAASEIFPSPPC